ncbi:hypothetical protein RDV78_10300 [Bacillota bacterium LX-D]|nr:hypothetical protein [Bacillota bacterium LX-D]
MAKAYVQALQNGKKIYSEYLSLDKLTRFQKFMAQFSRESCPENLRDAWEMLIEGTDKFDDKMEMTIYRTYFIYSVTKEYH